MWAKRMPRLSRDPREILVSLQVFTETTNEDLTPNRWEPAPSLGPAYRELRVCSREPEATLPRSGLIRSLVEPSSHHPSAIESPAPS